MNKSALISSVDLEQIIHNDDVILLDATYGQPVLYSIDGAQVFDIDVIADPKSSMPHMVPSADDFQTHVQNLGINKNSEIIVFDKDGFWMAAARAWWLFRLFGHQNVKILNGGLRNWSGDLTPVTQATKPKGNFIANFQSHLIQTYDDMANNNSHVLVDARPAGVFDAGHIDDALNIPLPYIMNQNGTLKDTESLKSVFAPILDLQKPIVTSCNSGVTACALALGLYECGRDDVAVYDGSWIEWNARHAA